MSKNTNLSFLTDYITADITNGRIGINNASPAYAFDVTGVAKFSSSIYGARALFDSDFLQNETSKVGIGFAGGYAQFNSWGANTSTYGGFKFQISVSNGGTYDALKIAPNGASTFAGNVTIDKSSPLLQLNAPTGTAGEYRISNGVGTTHWSMYSITGGSNTQGNWALYSLGKTGGAGSVIEVTPAGNVGIGLTNPQSQLHLNGELTFTEGGSDTVRKHIISHGHSDGSSPNNYISFNVSNGAGTTAERMRINGAGNVGVGMAPSAWGSFTAIQLGGNTYSAVASSNHYLNIAANSYYDGTNFRYISTGYTSRYQLSDSTHLWYVAGSGTAGNIVSYTSVMTMTSGGQLLIGMSSPVSFRSDAQLQVNNCSILRSNDGYNGNPSAVIYSGNDTSGTLFVEFTSSGFSRIGTISRSGASGVAYNTTSDIRLKKNINDALSSINKINSIQVRSFDWVADDSHQDFGFIAQELFKVAPEAVTKGIKEEDIWQVDNSKLVPLLIKSIQELSAEIEILKLK